MTAAEPLMLADDIRDGRAWRRETLSPRDWLVAMSPRCLEELDAAVAELRRNPLPTLLLSPTTSPLSACAELMGHVGARLRDGIGLAVVSRIPVERYEAEENRALCWLPSQLLEQPVAQAWNGAMLYDVRDTGRALEYGVRRSITNLDLTFHTDGPWLDVPPHFVGLYGINPAQEGGVSRFVSLCTVHNELRRRHPRLLVAPLPALSLGSAGRARSGDAKTGAQPVFEYDGRALRRTLQRAVDRNGAELTGTPLDAESRDSLAAMRASVDSPDLWVEFTIERGQIQYLNNRVFAHSRTDFQDAPEPERKRHLIRVWTREEGRRTFYP